MNKQLVKFGKRMDSAQDKEEFISFAKGAKNVLDLGAGTGAMARAIAKKYGCHVDAVDQTWKADCLDTCDGKVTYISSSISCFLTVYRHKHYKKYDCIILSAIIHELDEETLDIMYYNLDAVMADNCRIIIREPFIDLSLNMVNDLYKFFKLVSDNVPASKVLEYARARKLSSHHMDEKSFFFWLNLAFVLSYGEDSWEREKHEYRYAYDLKWCKEFFNLPFRSYTGFQVYSVLDKTYRQHFINAGIPGEAFDLINYTGMHVVFDYSKIGRNYEKQED